MVGFSIDGKTSLLSLFRVDHHPLGRGPKVPSSHISSRAFNSHLPEEEKKKKKTSNDRVVSLLAILQQPRANKGVTENAIKKNLVATGEDPHYRFLLFPNTSKRRRAIKGVCAGMKRLSQQIMTHD